MSTDKTDRNAVKRDAQDAANRTRKTQYLRAYTTPHHPTLEQLATHDYTVWFEFDGAPNSRHIGEAIHPQSVKAKGGAE